jgi:uncharacterized membrane protein YbhN (UPF0104 family)
MSHVIKDFFAGSLILVVLSLSALLGFILFFILNIFFHMFGALVIVFLIIFLFFFAIWLIGFLFRRLREAGKKQ